MPRLEIHPRYRPAAGFDLARWLRRWIALGLLTLLCLPIDAWHNVYVGWLPYWLVLAPAVSLALLRRERLTRASLAYLSARRHRGRHGARRRGMPLASRMRRAWPANVA